MKTPALPASRHRTLFIASLHAVFFVVLVVMFVYLYQLAIGSLHTEEIRRVEKVVDQSMNSLEIQIELYKQALYGARAFVMSDATINRQSWISFFDNNAFVRRMPGMSALGYVKKVRPAERAEFIQSIQKDTSFNGVGYPTFALYPEITDELADRYVITHVAPAAAENNSRAFGLDFRLDPVRWEALQKTRDSNRVAITEPIRGIDSGKPAFVMMLAWYDPAKQVVTPQDRVDAFGGVITTGFRNEEFFNGVFGQLAKDEVTVEVFDGVELSENALIYSNIPEKRVLGAETPADPVVNEKDNSITVLRQFDVAGRVWSIRFMAPHEVRSPQVSIPLPLMVLAMLVFIGFGSVFVSKMVVRNR
jgi:CHASE1-domain containing sensor protein